jgi:hypothetical protein
MFEVYRSSQRPIAPGVFLIPNDSALGITEIILRFGTN